MIQATRTILLENSDMIRNRLLVQLSIIGGLFILLLIFRNRYFTIVTKHYSSAEIGYFWNWIIGIRYQDQFGAHQSEHDTSALCYTSCDVHDM